jgi:hypothetical protein
VLTKEPPNAFFVSFLSYGGFVYRHLLLDSYTSLHQKWNSGCRAPYPTKKKGSEREGMKRNKKKQTSRAFIHYTPIAICLLAV